MRIAVEVVPTAGSHLLRVDAAVVTVLMVRRSERDST
jgi:hypothetical protein